MATSRRSADGSERKRSTSLFEAGFLEQPVGEFRVRVCRLLPATGYTPLDRVGVSYKIINDEEARENDASLVVINGMYAATARKLLQELGLL